MSRERFKRVERHVHNYTRLQESPVLLHDEESRLRSEDAAGGVTSGKDTLKQRVCVEKIPQQDGTEKECGAVMTYDLVRKRV